MPKTAAASKKCLPAWARWLMAWAAVLLASAGLVYFWRVAFLLPRQMPALPLFVLVAGVCSLLLGLVALLCRLKADSLCFKATLVVFALGLLFCFANAPLQTPDETAHYLRAVSLSMGRFTYNHGEVFPDDVSLLVQLFPHQMNHEITYGMGLLSPARLAEYQQALASGVQAAAPATAPIMFMNLPFALQALFMAVARLFGASALGLMYAGRLANLLVYSVISTFTLLNAARCRPLFLAMALLPLSLFMAASCSYDSIMLALCYYLLSFAFKEKVGRADLLLFAVALLLACYIKPNNLLLAGVLLAVPKPRWQLKWKRLWVAGLFAAAALGVFFAAGAGDSLLKLGWPAVLPRGGGDAADTTAQLAFMLQNPLPVAVRLLLTFVEQEGWLFGMGLLGAMDLQLPLVGGLSVLGLVFAAGASALAPMDKTDRQRRMTLALAAVALVYGGAILCGMYVADTDVGAMRVSGLQPRYFLPAFLLLFAAAALLLNRLVARLGAFGGEDKKLGANPGPQALAIKAETVALWVAAALALVAVVLLFQANFIGQWLPKAEGGWKLVNLFGWKQS